MGGSASDIANPIAIDSNGDFFTGEQAFSTDMLGYNVAGATKQFNNGGTSSAFKADGFICKINGDGNAILWRCYFGGSGSETINSLFIDGANNLYIAGYSSSFDCPVVNAFKPALSPTTAANPSNTDAIFGKFNSNMTAQWITYYGGSANVSGGGTATQDWGYDIVVDNSGNVIGCGLTDATDLQTTNTTGNPNTFFDNTIGAGTSSDGFLVRYNSGGVLDFSSYFGGNGSEAVNRLVYKSGLNEIYFAGDASSATAFPFFPKAGATNSQYTAGGRTAFLGYMDGSLTKQWCSFYGRGQVGTKLYTGSGLSVDNSGLVYLSGYTTSDTLQAPGLTPTGVYVDNTRSGDDGYVAVFTPGKQLFHAHYFGGISNDRILNSYIAQNQKLYITGYTQSVNFPIAYTPTTASLIDSTYSAGQDGFISRFTLSAYQIIGIQKFEYDNTTLTVFPNPANTQFNLELKDGLKSKATVKVYTMMGQLVCEKEVTEKSTQINCESWANGVYLINVSNNESQRTFKLIKQ